ncbi:MAG: hypothetical protein CVU09_16615 [Bacteroidetes bacterium HGW-Bacteroidetes-4]|jgi:hypothetical protein|nr:MAG: hypothetical protein CVU09_16615 [Bacteroidetes bacterium HGW-Bacteroidetes-4]
MSYLHKQEKLPVYQSLIGLILFLTSFILWGFYRQSMDSDASAFAASGLLPKYLFRQFISFKAFTLASFVFGLHAFFCATNNAGPKYKLMRSILPLIVVTLAGLFQPVFWGVLPILFMGVLFSYIRPVHSVQLFTLAATSLLIALFTAGIWGIPELQKGAFYALAPMQKPIQLFISRGHLFFIPEHFFNWFYGFSLLFLGYSAGNAKVLLHYPFFYTNLKRLFKISIALIVLWVLLTFLGAYQLIMHWRLGQMFYLIDAIAVTILLAFVYVFILIYLENFNWGKIILSGFVLLGKHWYISFLYLAITYKLIRHTNLFITPLSNWLLLLLQPFLMLLLSLLAQRVIFFLKKESF